jgi:2-polyprenyl-3-methyl-5-hydroxy-6-metoxy-1,4-benzoquinol methylase
MLSESAANKTKSQQIAAPTYSEQLFGKGLYARHHQGRFEWLRRKFAALARAEEISVLEVGCHDGRALKYIPHRVWRYAGFDAGWGGGLERGRQRFAAEKNYTFTESTEPRDVAKLAEKFDFIICMETLEHLDNSIVEGYLRAFAEKLNGYLLITVPNEKGFALLVKATGARVMNIERYYPYTAAEFFWGLLGCLDRVRRSEHKGFDYADLVRLIQQHFKYVSVEGIGPFRFPPSLSLTIGIVASQKPIPRQG